MPDDRTKRDYLTELLTRYWFAPPVALWRAVELRTVARQTFERPVLDLGCGDGLIGQVLLGGGRQVEAGIDPWLAQLRQAVRSGVYQSVALAEGSRLPYADGAFATVFSNSVLEHIAALEPVLREAGRVLRAGGRFIFSVPSDAFPRLLDGWIRRMAAGKVREAQTYLWQVDTWLAHYHYHTPAEWKYLLAEHGMRQVTARYYIPEEVERLWDRENGRYGLGRGLPFWRLLVSPRLRGLGYQALLRRLVVGRLSRRWRRAYELDVPEGEVGGGLLVVGQKM